jgi:hypothetical protein
MPTDSHNSSDRTIELRKLLVATVSAPAFPPARFSRKAIIGAIAAFALAGAATGGAVSAVAVSNNSQTDPVQAAQYLAEGVIGTHGTLLGTPVTYSGNGDAVINLGVAPASATAMVVALNCVDVGSPTVTIDARTSQPRDLQSGGLCSGMSGQEVSLSGTQTHSVTIKSAGDERIAVFASWVKEPPLPAASAAQTAVMADGIVTRSEYLASYNRYAGCMTAAGYPLPSVSDDYVYYPFAITDDAVSSGADARCYASEFKEVDMTWQLYVQKAVSACLMARGVTPVSLRTKGLTDLLEQLLPLHVTFDQCSAEQPPTR